VLSIACAQPNGITLGQDVLQSVFERHLENHFGVKIERGIELVKFSVPDSETEPIKAQLRSSNGSEQDVTCRFLVGADGGHSGVRKALGLPFDGHTMPGTMVYGDVCVEGEGMDLEHWHSWTNPSNGVRIGIWSVSRDPARPRAYRLFGASEEDARAMVADTDFAAKFFASQTGRTDLRLSNWQLTCAK
jgi:2-polyprenyl-6-methoxyphenol hydroxylase-like FAD-dependent oxidoreductase